ncbi:hypothetical protein KFE25_004953 [Diacronema lutheri]|uniref:Uncharacterized protein n=2 Tax=Diacronema lutheri TaxID=2081491 RepID=A0A8J5XKY0_DIALT|nr:hypothetical protein KFE25_004953 [Diacronema lutheri]
MADDSRAALLTELFRVGAAHESPSAGAAVAPRNLCDMVDLSLHDLAPEPVNAAAAADDAPATLAALPPPPPAAPAAPTPRAVKGSAAARAGDDSDSDVDDASGRRAPTGAHTLSDDDSDCPSEPDELAARTVELEARLRRARSTWALDDERTLAVVFKLLDALVAQYQLNRMDELFAEFVPICAKVRGKWHLKAIQSKAFCCFKQYRFREALALFKEQEQLMGPSAPLAENIGHVCSSLSEYDEAERYFRLATRLLPDGRQHAKNSGGVYLGLGLLLDRRERPREALPILYQALELYVDSCHMSGRFVESSLVAKARMSLGHAHEHAGELSKAEEHMREAVGIFSRTVGEQSPLLAGALGSLGKLRVRQGALADGARHLVRALGIEVDKDAFHARTVWELLEDIKSVHEKELLQRTEPKKPLDIAGTFAPYAPVVGRAVRRIDALGIDASEGDTTSVLRKTAGEMLLLGGQNEEALAQLTKAAGMFRGFTHCDVSSLVRACEELIAVALERLRPIGKPPTPAMLPRFSDL